MSRIEPDSKRCRTETNGASDSLENCGGSVVEESTGQTEPSSSNEAVNSSTVKGAIGSTYHFKPGDTDVVSPCSVWHLCSVYEGGVLFDYVADMYPALSSFLNELRGCDETRFEEVFSALASPEMNSSVWRHEGVPVNGVLASLCLSALMSGSPRQGTLSKLSGLSKLPEYLSPFCSIHRAVLLKAQFYKYRTPIYRDFLKCALHPYITTTHNPQEVGWPSDSLLTDVRRELSAEERYVREPAFLCFTSMEGRFQQHHLWEWEQKFHSSHVPNDQYRLSSLEECSVFGISAEVAAQPGADLSELATRFSAHVPDNNLLWMCEVVDYEDLSAQHCVNGCVLIRLGMRDFPQCMNGRMFFNHYMVNPEEVLLVAIYEDSDSESDEDSESDDNEDSEIHRESESDDCDGDDGIGEVD